MMNRTIGTVVESLNRAHTALFKDLQKLEHASRANLGEDLAKVRERLDATRTHITEHFRFEEQDGYMVAVGEREPRLQRAIHHLADEHRELSRSLDALVEEARTTTTPGDPFREKLREWIEHVRRHEARENELVQDALNWDIGAED
jgi:hemerythrin